MFAAAHQHMARMEGQAGRSADSELDAIERIRSSSKRLSVRTRRRVTRKSKSHWCLRRGQGLAYTLIAFGPLRYTGCFPLAWIVGHCTRRPLRRHSVAVGCFSSTRGGSSTSAKTRWERERESPFVRECHVAACTGIRVLYWSRTSMLAPRGVCADAPRGHRLNTQDDAARPAMLGPRRCVSATRQARIRMPRLALI